MRPQTLWGLGIGKVLLQRSLIAQETKTRINRWVAWHWKASARKRNKKQSHILWPILRNVELLPFPGSDTQVISPWALWKSWTRKLVRANTTKIQASFLALQSHSTKIPPQKKPMFFMPAWTQNPQTSLRAQEGSRKGSMRSLVRLNLESRDLYSKRKPFCLLEKGVSVNKSVVLRQACCNRSYHLVPGQKEGVGNISKMHCLFCQRAKWDKGTSIDPQRGHQSKVPPPVSTFFWDQSVYLRLLSVQGCILFPNVALY